MPGAEDQKTNEQLEAERLAAEEAKNKENPNPGDADKSKEGKKIQTLEEALKEIENLRKENGNHRVKNKSLEDLKKTYDEQFSSLKKAMGIEDESENPEEKVKQLSQAQENLELELGLVSAARAHSIPMEHDAFFRFLLKEKIDSLKEGEELGDEEIAAVAAQVMTYSGQKKNKSTGVDDSKGGKKDPEDKVDEVTQEQFNAMGLMQRNKLYSENKDLYAKLHAGSKKK